MINCIIGKNGRKYYFRDGKRISNAEGEKSKVECYTKGDKSRLRNRKSRTVCS